MTPTRIAPRDWTKTERAEDAIEAFGRQLRGTLLTHGDESFDNATKIWNGMIEKTSALVARPTGTADVVTAVEFARAHDLALCIQHARTNLY